MLDFSYRSNLVRFTPKKLNVNVNWLLSKQASCLVVLSCVPIIIHIRIAGYQKYSMRVATWWYYSLVHFILLSVLLLFSPSYAVWKGYVFSFVWGIIICWHLLVMSINITLFQKISKYTCHLTFRISSQVSPLEKCLPSKQTQCGRPIECLATIFLLVKTFFFLSHAKRVLG